PAQTWGPLAHRPRRAAEGDKLHCSLESANAVVQGRELHADLAEEASGLEPTVRAGAGRGLGAAGGHGGGGGGQWSGCLNRNGWTTPSRHGPTRSLTAKKRAGGT